jgi:hypothetical protein
MEIENRGSGILVKSEAGESLEFSGSQEQFEEILCLLVPEDEKYVAECQKKLEDGEIYISDETREFIKKYCDPSSSEFEGY